MSASFTIGKRSIESEDILSMLSGHGLLPQLMQGIVVDKVLRSFSCSEKEIVDYYQPQITADPDFIDKKRSQLILEGVQGHEVDFFISRPVLLEIFKQKTFSHLTESTFLKLKTGLDKVVFNILRHKDHELMRELYFRIDSGEDDFHSVAERYSEGRESKTGGKIGPVEMRQLNPKLAGVLSSLKPGFLNQPVLIDGFAVIVQLKEKLPVQLDDSMKNQIINQLFNEWVQKEVQSYFY